MKIAKINLTSIKESDGWNELMYELLFEKFQKENPDLDEDDQHEKFYTNITSKIFEYGEFADLEIQVDEKLNIVGGKIIPFKND